MRNLELATDATDEGGPEDAVGRHGLTCTPCGDELSHRFGGYPANLLRNDKRALLEDATGEARVKEKERVLGLDLLRPRKDLRHAERPSEETLLIFQ